MPDLSNTVRWVEFAPDLLGNHEADRPFYFLLHGSMSKEQMRALREAMGRTVGPPPPPELGPNPTPEQVAEREATLAQYSEAVSEAVVDRDATALEPYVRFGNEPLYVDGRQLQTIRDYLELVMSPRLLGLNAYFEVERALTAANTMDARTLFSSGRLSGGFTSTASRSSGRAAGQTAARRSG